MKLNRFFSVILCAALFSSNIGFAAEGWRDYVPTWEGARTALQGARESMPTWEGIRQAAANKLWEGSTGQKMWQGAVTRGSDLLQRIPASYRKFVADNYGKLLVTMIGLYGINKVRNDINVFIEEKGLGDEGWGAIAPGYVSTRAREAKQKATGMWRSYAPERLGGKPIKKSVNPRMAEMEKQKSIPVGEEAEVPLSFEGYEKLNSSQQSQYLGAMPLEKAEKYQNSYMDWLGQQPKK